MKRLLLAVALCAPLTLLAEGEAKDPFVNGDAAAGATKAATCFACHGPGGNGAINPDWPKLAGQGSAYIVEQLKAFKSGARKQPVMMGQVASLSDQDMADLAAYFASQAPMPGVASKDAVEVGQRYYRGGDEKDGVPACAGCHGPTGAGNPAAMFPRIGGQNAGYTATQLKSYRSGERGATGNGQIMAAIAAKLNDQDIAAIASYVSGLQ